MIPLALPACDVTKHQDGLKNVVLLSALHLNLRSRIVQSQVCGGLNAVTSRCMMSSGR
jgi:hypothetical protein